MSRIAIIGLGLMGGSLGLALRSSGFRGTVVGYSRSTETRERARHMRAVDEIFAEPDRAVADADVVVLCTPIMTMPRTLRECRDNLKPECVVTDVGSTKSYLADSLPPIIEGRAATYIGSHPICGSEQQGIEAARADLYKDATVVVAVDKPAPPARYLQLVHDLWKSVGGITREVSPGEHDMLLARTSHLPHLAASLLTVAIGRDPMPRDLVRFCGSGFRDTTRIAEGAPSIWHDIIATNRDAVLSEVSAYRDELDRFIEELKQSDFTALQRTLERGRMLRQSLAGDTPSHPR